LLFIGFLAFVSSTYGATLTVSNGVPVNPMLFAGNDVWISAQLTYDSPALKTGLGGTFMGGVRFPGGAVANYWNLTSSQYVKGCNDSACKQWAVPTAKFPANTFSAKNFFNGVVSHVKSQSAVIDLNLLTMTVEEIKASLDTIKASNIDVMYLELGNEYYLKRYNPVFPNSTVYMEKCKPVIAYARKLFPNAKIAAVASFGEILTRPGPWNNELSKYVDILDALTIHSYKLNDGLAKKYGVDKAPSVLASFGEAELRTAIDKSQSIFGRKMKFWMTEYNIAGHQPYLESIRNGPAHALFMLGHMLTGVNYHDQIEMVMIHSATNLAWDTTAGIIKVVDVSYPQVSETSQFMALLNYIALYKSEMMHPVKVTDAPSIGIENLGFANLSCIQAAAFTGKDSMALAVLNRCDKDIVIELNKEPDFKTFKQISYKANAEDEATWSNIPSSLPPWDVPAKPSISSGSVVSPWKCSCGGYTFSVIEFQ